MALFDRYLMVDWSAANGAKTGKDSVWTCLVTRNGGQISVRETQNFPTRAAVMAYVAAMISDAASEGEKLLAGFDFAFSYPAGAAERMAGLPSWDAVWARLADLIDDDDANISNRLEAAGQLNMSAFGDGALFWGCPPGRSIAGLSATRPAPRADGLAHHRIAERHAKGAKSVWQLMGAGSVGSQSLTGIARLEKLRQLPQLAGATKIWPYETGFGPSPLATCTIAEIYPSLFASDMPEDEIKDRAQVQHVAQKFAELDSSGRLAHLMDEPAGLSPQERALVLAEEGWILGIGHERLNMAEVPPVPHYDYIRDPAEIYRNSFATIRSEVDLSRFPKGMDALAIRLIHACGMVDLVDDIAFSPDGFAIGAAALAAGAPVLCDVEMVRHGIIRKLMPATNDIVCMLNEPGVSGHAKVIGNTRSAAQVDFWTERLEGSVVAIGNAPTALFRLLETIASGGPKPALILGFPVGFVGAAESKEALVANPFGVPFISVKGRRGGSAMASAAVNALGGGLNAND